MRSELNPLGQPVGPIVPDWSPLTPPDRIPLSGRFCRLEPLDIATHARALWDANQSDAEGRMWTYMPYGPFDTFGAYQAWLTTVATTRDPLFYAIIDTRTNRATGLASYLRINAADGTIEVGHLTFSPLLQGTPAATEAMFLMMQRAFALGYRRYEWKCDAFNAPSRAAALRLGFSFEGIFLHDRIVKGRNRNTAWFSIIETEWPARESAFMQWLAPENFDEQGIQRTRLSDLTRPLHR